MIILMKSKLKLQLLRRSFHSNLYAIASQTNETRVKVLVSYSASVERLHSFCDEPFNTC